MGIVIIFFVTKKDNDRENIINKYWFLNLLSQFINIVLKTLEIILHAVYSQKEIF